MTSMQEQIDGVVADLTRLLGETPRDLVLIGVLQARETGLRAQLAAEAQRGVPHLNRRNSFFSISSFIFIKLIPVHCPVTGSTLR